MKVIETYLVLIDKYYISAKIGDTTEYPTFKEIATLHKMENGNWICVHASGAFDKLLEESALKLIEDTVF